MELFLGSAASCGFELPRSTACKPSCVDCLVAAMQHGCDGGKTERGLLKCPVVSTNMLIPPACEHPHYISGYYDENGVWQYGYYDESNGYDGLFATDKDLYSFNVRSPAIEWYGSCHAGDCKVCSDGDTRCGGFEGSETGVSQVCMNGEWHREISWEKHKASALQADSALIAISVMLAFCLLALLGAVVITMIKFRSVLTCFTLGFSLVILVAL